MTTRRQFLLSSTAVLTACGAAPPPERHAARVLVTGLEIFRVRVNRLGNWVLARLQTSAGLTGIGDASHAGKDDPQVVKLQEYFERIQGRSIYDIEWLRQSVWPEHAAHRRSASCAFSAIEQALYDLQGQVAGVPTYQLFGGKLRDKIRNYANINRSTEQRTPEGFAAMARSAADAGFDAIKLAPFDGMKRMTTAAERKAHIELGIDCARAVREVLGPGGDLLIDAHSHFDLAGGLDLARRMEPLDLFWLEEVSKSPGDLAAINREAKAPTAGGESLFGIEENLRYIEARAADILMPDVKYCGGMLELKKISALAEAAGLRCSPHGPASPVGNVAAAQVCAGLPNFQILEFSHGEVPWRAELIDPPEAIDKGYLTLSDRPGFGVTLNDKLARRHQAE